MLGFFYQWLAQRVKSGMAKMVESSKNDQYYEERRDNGKLSRDSQPQSCHYIHKIWQKAILGRPIFKNETRQKMNVDPLGSPLMYAIWPFRIIKCCGKSAQRPCSQGWLRRCYSDPYWTKWTQTDQRERQPRQPFSKVKWLTLKSLIPLIVCPGAG